VSAVPPNILGAAAQAGFVAPEAARTRDADRSGQAQIAAKQVERVKDSANSVETTDGDTAVFADAEGAGGQGRATDDGSDQPVEESLENASDTEDGDASQLDIKI
jgi:hypothetical protein